ncbi:MAG: Mut7-C RNAse domain-containing protein [Acidobacteriota bacterium]
MPLKRAEKSRFIADCMLGWLAKWLRVLGYDVAYERDISDDALIVRSWREGRILLTRDTALVKRRALRRSGGESLLIASDRVEEQLVQTVEQCGLIPRRNDWLSRCLRCNELMQPVSRREVESEVPAYVFRTQERFSRCPACGRVFWRASHVARILERLSARFGVA